MREMLGRMLVAERDGDRVAVRSAASDIEAWISSMPDVTAEQRVLLRNLSDVMAEISFARMDGTLEEKSESLRARLGAIHNAWTKGMSLQLQLQLRMQAAVDHGARIGRELRGRVGEA